MDAAQLRPLRVGEILDVAIRVYREKFATMVKAVAVVVLPVQVLNVLVRLSLPASTTTTDSSTGTVHFNGSAFATTIAGLLVLLVASVMSSTLAQAACFKTVGDTYLGSASDWRSSLRFGFSRFWRLLGLILLHGLLLLVAFAACVVPGIWLYAAWSVAVPVLLIEGTGGFRALTRSHGLVKGRWWPVAGTLLVATLLAAFVSAIFGFVLVPVAVAGGNQTLATVLSGITGAIGALLTTPFIAAVVTVLYFDLRVRKEGFDLQLMAWRMGVPEPQEGFRGAMPWSAQPGFAHPAQPWSQPAQPWTQPAQPWTQPAQPWTQATPAGRPAPSPQWGEAAAPRTPEPLPPSFRPPPPPGWDTGGSESPPPRDGRDDAEDDR
ncbi:MAG: hypothetical protein JOZ99_08725 [Actinobacteria bacterium]|nr:hypothetical protein [Actinomycetota bacterium]